METSGLEKDFVELLSALWGLVPPSGGKGKKLRTAS